MALDANAVAWLLTPDGARATAVAEAALAAGTSTLSILDRLRPEHGGEGARAALGLAEGRRSASAKFPDAGALFFDRESAEQATNEVVARHTARRFAGARRIADLGCGAGADSLALAEVAPVLAVDRDPGRLALTRANAAARGLAERIEALESDVGAVTLPPDIDAVWLDPGRRDDSGRVLDPEGWSPPLSEAIRLASSVARSGIKVAPGIERTVVPVGAELEFISLEGRLVEAVLWLGSAVTTPRRATALAAGRLAEDATLAGSPDTGATRIAPPGRYLYDLDPSVGRASLVDMLAPSLAAWRLDEAIAYLSGDEARESPFARRFRVLEWMPFAERRVLQALQRAGARRVEVMRRGSPVETNPLEVRLNRMLAAGGTRAGEDGRVLTVALTRLTGSQAAIVCERERPGGRP